MVFFSTFSFVNISQIGTVSKKKPGEKGENLLKKADGTVADLGSRKAMQVEEGDAVVIKTTGGGGDGGGE